MAFHSSLSPTAIRQLFRIYTIKSGNTFRFSYEPQYSIDWEDVVMQELFSPPSAVLPEEKNILLMIRN